MLDILRLNVLSVALPVSLYQQIYKHCIIKSFNLVYNISLLYKFQYIWIILDRMLLAFNLDNKIHHLAYFLTCLVVIEIFKITNKSILQ